MAIPNSKLLILASESLKEFKLSNVTLAFKDSPGLEHISPRAQWIVDEPVAVVDDESQVIGSARIFDAGHKIMADLYLISRCPQRLEIETQCRKLYPIAFFESLEFDGAGLISQLRLTRIEIRPDDNPFDDRIVPLSVAPL